VRQPWEPASHLHQYNFARAAAPAANPVAAPHKLAQRLAESRSGKVLLALAVSALLAALVCFLGYMASQSPLMGDLSKWGYDLLVVRAPASPPASDIIIVDFGDDAVAFFKKFPIPRTAVAQVLRRVTAGKPELVGLDLLLSEARSPDEDRQLAAALAEAQNVILANQMPSAQLPAQAPLPIFCQPDAQAPAYCASGAFGLGFVNLPVDDDGFVRRMFLLPPRGYAVLPWAVALASNYRRQELRPGPPGTVLFGATQIPIDPVLNTFFIGVWSFAPAREVSALRVLTPGFDSGLFRGKLVLIGQSSEAGKDRHFTPMFRTRRAGAPRLLSGTQIQAAAIATLLQGRAIRVLPAGQLWALNLAAAFLVLALILLLRPAFSVPAVVAAGIVLYGVAQFLFDTRHLWLDFISGAACLLLALPAGVGYRFLEERWLKSRAEAERRQLMGIFARYVSPEVAEEIWKRRGEFILAGEEKTATVLFSDIRSFTANTAGKPPNEVLAWLNEYFTAMADVIRQNGGFLNKFIGDGIMAVYGVPISSGPAEDACRAVQTALEMDQRVAELRQRHAGDPSYPPLKIGVGIHTGPLTAGNVGSRDRLEYSVIGETVNLASRLESLTKDFHCDLVLSPDTYELIKDRFGTRLLGNKQVRGLEIKGEIPLYTVVPPGHSGDAS
jgi:adenylate cyclase